MATEHGKLRIEPVFTGNSTAVDTYKVVDNNGTIHFQGDYGNCYLYIHPDQLAVFDRFQE